MKLGADANGRRYGISGGQAFAQSYLPLLPAVLLALLARGVLRGWPQWLAPVTLAVPCALPANLPPAVPVLAGYGSLLGSIAAAYSIIPSAVRAAHACVCVKLAASTCVLSSGYELRLCTTCSPFCARTMRHNCVPIA